MNMQCGHAAWTCSIGHEHEARACRKDMRHGHVAWTYSLDMQHGQVAWTWSMDMWAVEDPPSRRKDRGGEDHLVKGGARVEVHPAEGRRGGRTTL